MHLEVRNWDNEVVGKVELQQDVFSYPARPHLVYEVVKAYLAGLRRGTHATKNRALVSGGGKKPWKQKGTGRSRHGSSRSPLWRHGGTTFGPQPRSYALKVNIKAKKNALRSVLSEKLAGGALHVLESLEIESHRTKEFMERLGKLGLDGQKVLFIDSFENLNLMLATRNRPELESADSLHVHVYQTMNAKHVVFSRRALQQLVEVLSS
jgi:large subunit ribosomal protein L4